MTEETTPQEESQEAVTPATEEPKVNLAEEAAKGIRNEPAAKAKELEQQLTQELPPEAVEKMRKMVESQVSSAVDGNRRKMEADFEKRLAAQGYQTPEQVKAQIAEELTFERQKAEAGRNLDRTLNTLGVAPGTEEYKKVETAFAQGLKDGVVTYQTLLSEQWIKAVAFAAGVVNPEPKQEAPALPGLGSHTTVPQKSPDAKPGDLDRLAHQRMMEALGN